MGEFPHTTTTFDPCCVHASAIRPSITLRRRHNGGGRENYPRWVARGGRKAERDNPFPCRGPHAATRVHTHTWRPKGEPGGLGRGKRIEHQKVEPWWSESAGYFKIGAFFVFRELVTFWGVLGLVCVARGSNQCSAFGSANGGRIYWYCMSSDRGAASTGTQTMPQAAPWSYENRIVPGRLN